MSEWDDEPTPSRRSSRSSQPRATIDPQHVSGHYLGHGGQGVVVQGRDRHLPRDVAWKMVQDDDVRGQACLRQEARVLAMLEHPHIVPVYDLVDDGTSIRMATRFVRGRSLRAQLAAPLAEREPTQLLRHMLEVSRAIGFAHEHGVVHCDIKPHNIMIGERGETQVIDWGLALVIADAAEPVGRVVGTPAYMSPEQARGERAQPGSDVWALGATLVEVVTGSPLWSLSDASILAELCRGLRPQIDTSAMPPELAVIIGRALAPDPESRYSDARTLTADLEAYLDRKPTPAPAAEPIPRTAPTTRWTTSGDVSIAYQVFGSGPTDLVMIPGFVSHLEVSWEDPSFASFLDRLGASHRVIFFDKRGTGMSDRVDVSSLGDRLEDIRAVMDAAGSERAAMVGVSEGGVLALLFAALYPERVSALAIYASVAKSTVGPDYPMGMPLEVFDWGYSEIRQKWGGPVFIEVEAPSRIDDATFRAWWARYLKMGGSPGAAIAILKANSKIDVRHLLPGIGVPTIVLRRSGDRLTPFESCRHVADKIPGARFVALAGDDHLPFVGDGAVVDTLLDFIAAPHPARADIPLVAFVLAFNPIGPQWAALAPHVSEILTRHGGSPLPTSRIGQQLHAFRLPSGAISCAIALAALATTHGAPATVALHLDVLARAGLGHSQDVLDRVTDMATNATPNRIIATRIVRDLATRVDLSFEALSPDPDDPAALFIMHGALR